MPFKLLFRDDIFISYSRADGGAYAAGLADKLTGLKFSCFIDKLGTEPDEDLPESLKKKIRNCTLFVLVGTERAAASEFVAKEIAEFRKSKRTILPVDFNGAVGRAVWYRLIPGLAAEPEENPGALAAGEPSANVISRIEKSFNYTRRNQRMLRVLTASLAFFLILIAASVVAGYVAKKNIDLAREESEKASVQRQKAREAEALAEQQTRAAADAQREAASQTQAAHEAAKRAEEQRKLADAAEKRREAAERSAKEAERLAEVARAEAERQTKRSRRLLYGADMQLAQRYHEAGWPQVGKEFLDAHARGAGRTGGGEGLPAEDDLHGFEFYYLWHLYHPELRVLNNSSLMKPEFSLDIAVTPAKGVRMLNMRTAETRELKGADRSPLGVVFTPDATTFALLDVDRVAATVWDTATGQKLHVLNPQPAGGGTLESAAFSPDGKLLALGYAAKPEESLMLWDLTREPPASSRSWNAGHVTALAFSPDGSVVTTVSQNRSREEIRLWSVQTGEELPKLLGPSPPIIYALAFSPTGEQLAVAGSAVIVWDLSTREIAVALKPQTSMFTSVAFSPDGKVIATGTGRGTVQLWDAANGQELKVLGFHATRVTSLVFSPDRKTLASEGEGSIVKLWDVRGAELFQSAKLGGGVVSGFKPQGATFLPGGEQLVLSDLRGEVKTLDLESRAVRTVLEGGDHYDTPALSPDGRRFARVEGHAVKVRALGTLKEEMRPCELNGRVTGVLAFSPDGKKLAVGFSPNEDEIAAHEDEAATPSDGLPAPRVDEFVGICNLETGANEAIIPEQATAAAIAFSPDGETFAAGSLARSGRAGSLVGPTHVRLGSTANPREQARPVPELKVEKQLGALAFSPDGRRLAMSDGVDVKIFDLQSLREPPSTLKGHATSIDCIVFSPDGKRLITAARDTTIKVWDIATHKEVITLKGHLGQVKSLAFSPDGVSLVSIDSEGDIRLWRGAAK